MVAWCLPIRIIAGQAPVADCTEPARLWEIPALRFRTVEEVPLKAGRYGLTMRATAGAAAGKTAHGTVDFQPAPRTRAHGFLDGKTDLPLRQVGISSAQVGALIGRWDDFRASFVIGGSTSPEVPKGNGALLELAIADSNGVRGRWFTRGDGAAVMRGYFCLVPVPRRKPMPRRYP